MPGTKSPGAWLGEAVPGTASFRGDVASIGDSGRDRRRRAAQELQERAGARRRQLRGARRRGVRPARPERRGQIHDGPHARHAHAARFGPRARRGRGRRPPPEPRAAIDRLCGAGLGRRLGGHRAREPAPAGADPRHGGRAAARPGRRAARARRAAGSSRSHRPRLLRRHEAPPRHRDRAGTPPARPLSRRADDRARPGGARGDVVGGLAPCRGRVADDPADDPLPGRRPTASPSGSRSSAAARSSSRGGRRS